MTNAWWSAACILLAAAVACIVGRTDRTDKINMGWKKVRTERQAVEDGERNARRIDADMSFVLTPKQAANHHSLANVFPLHSPI
jgi:hypothetical protein